MKSWTALLCLAGWLIGCPASDDDDATPAPPRLEQWFGGSSSFTPPGGAAYPPGAVWIHRLLDGADDTITEDVWQVDGGAAPTHFLLRGDIDVAAGTYSFSFTDDYGTFEGQGTLVGEAWVWPQWSSRSTYVDGPYFGSYVVSEDRLTETGMRADKQVFSPDDHAEGTIVELLDAVEAAAWQAAVDAL